ncbi:hypothetical protein RYX36_033686, partial [Vicia faba]
VKRLNSTNKLEKISDLTIATRKIDKLRILKLRDINGPNKEPNNTLVISGYEETTIDIIGGANISKRWTNICKGLTQ